MKHFKQLLTLALFAIFGIGQMWGTEEVYKTALFGSDYNDENQVYTSSFDATNGSFVVTATNFNNNKNEWTNSSGLGQIKCGRKNNASVGTITTKAAIDDAITKVVVTVDAFTSGKVNSFKLYVASNSTFTQNLQTITATIKTGANTFTVTTPTASRYYKVEINCASGSSNGLVTISKVEYYHSASSGCSNTPSMSFSPDAVEKTVGDANFTKTVSITGKGDGQTVAYSSSNTSVATVNSSTGEVTINTNGSTTITASVAENGDYCSTSATYTLTVNKPSYTVNWYVGGTQVKTESVTKDETATLPATPADNALGGSCSSLEFMGWSETNIGSTGNTAPLDLFTAAPTITSAKNYYAVFAESSIAFEDDMNISGTSGVNSRAGWASFSSAYGNNGCIRLSTGSATGSMSTNALTSLTSATTQISFKIKAWSGTENGQVTLSASKGTIATTSFTATTTSFTDVSTTITGGDNTTTITFTGTSGKRINIKDISIGEVSNYVTTCCDPLGSINGSINLTNENCGAGELKATWKTNSEGLAGIASQVLHIYKASDDTEVTAKKIIDIEPSTSNQTQTISGLDNCTAYYVTVENISNGGSYCGDGLAGAASSSVTTKGYTYTITPTNVSLKAGATEEGSTCDGDFSAQYEAAAGYALPTSLTVSGASAHTWSVSEGVGTLSINAANVTGNVTTTIAGTCVAPDITGHPASANYVADPVAAATALSVTASAAGADLDYQWQSKVGEGAWTNIQGATNSTYTPSRTTAGVTQYRVVLTNHTCSESSNSNAATITVTVPSVCIAPTFDPEEGTYTGTQSVVLASETTGATVYYTMTTDGSEPATPTSGSTAYSSAISVTENTRIKAIAIKDGMEASSVQEAEYIIKCETPAISPAAGTYTGTKSVTITCATDGATIYYTTDGSTPDNTKTEYTGSFKVTNSKTVKAIAIKSGMENSAIVSAAYTIQHTITWSANGSTTTSTVTDGNKLVLPVSAPTTCNDDYNTFIGWYSVAAGTAEDPSTNVSGTKADADHTPTGDETYYAVWGNGELVGGWQKVTSIAANDVVLFVHDEAAKKEMTDIALINTNMCGIATDYTTSLAGTYPLTIETGNGGSGYSFKTSANTYLSWSSGNTLTTSETKDDASSWTISTSTDGNFKFANVGTTERILQFNNSQYRWACYGNSNQTAFQIYKQTAGATGFISNCCEEWTATAKYGESNVINVDDVVAVTVTETVHGTASYESDDTDVLTVASDGKITGKKAGSATVTISWAGADGYCAYETTVDVMVNGTITVTYNKNDGSLTPATTSQNATSNSAFKLNANSFSRTGYTFQGWATTPSGEKEYNNSQADVEFAEDITLYAVWSINSHAVTLTQPTGNTIEATGAANLASVAYGTSITLSTTENDGYVFTGWSATGVSLANTNPVVFSMPDNDVTVTATYSTYSWIAADPRYTVTTAPKISYTKVEKFSTAGVVIKENFKRSDDNTITKQETYTGAWTAKLNGVAIANGADLSLDDNGKTLKLYVDEVEIASYTLTVTDIDSDQFIDGLWGETFEAQTGTYDMPTPSSHAAGATDCAKHNTFAGWILEANAENPTVENIITGAAATGITAANNTYYAVWSKSENVNKEFTVSKTGFASSEISSGTISTGITYTTQKNGGSSKPGQTGTSMRLYQILSGQKDGNSITVSGASGVTLTKVEFTTTGSAYGYVTNSYTTGNTTALTSGTVTDGKITLEDLSTDKLTVVNMATSNSYRLDISKIEVTYEKEVTEVDYITDCDPRYDVEFLAGTGATGSYDKVTKKAGVEITLPDGSALSKDHHTFAGWYSAYYDVTYSESTSMTYTVPVDGDILEAQWTEDHYGTVSFKNGETTTSTIKVYDGGTYDLAAALVQAGKEFIGWKWDGSIYTAGQANQHMTNPAEDRTYTAVWMPVIDVATADAADLSDGKWILVQNKSQLKAGDFIVIAAAGYNAALSNYQKTGNRGDAAVTKIADTLTYTSNVAPLFLQYDPENDYYAFYDRAYTTNTDVAPSQKGYLYAPNALKTQSNITMQGVWTIDIADKKASIVAQGNNSDKIMRYNKGANLFNCYGTATQSDIAIYKWVKKMTADMNISDITLTDAVIVPDGITLTINVDATLDNLTVESGGKVQIAENKQLDVQDFYIGGTHGKSGQVTHAENLSVNGDAYFDFTLGVDVSTTEGAVKAEAQWHNFSVPFPVDATNGVFNAETGEKLTNEVDYAIEDYHGEIRAEGNYGWKKFRTIMTPGHTYSMTVNGDIQTYRFKRSGNDAFVANPTVDFSEHASGDPKNAGWNGLGNMRLCYSSISNDDIAETEVQGVEGRYVLVLDAESYNYVAYLLTNINLTVGSAFFIQASDDGTMGFNDAQGGADKIYAPARTRQQIVEPIMITMSGESGTDHMYISADEDATSTYQIGRDMQRMFATSNPTTPLIYTMNYGGLKLAAEDAPLVNDQTAYTLQLYAPMAGEYTLKTASVADADIYLTYEGTIIWNISESEYTVDLSKGKNDGYGLLLKANAPAVATGVDEVNAEANVQKVVLNDKVFILRSGHMYDVTGKMVK